MPQTGQSTRSGKKTFPGLSALAFAHPTDTAALASLRKVPGIDSILKFFFRILYEKRARLLFLPSAVRVSENQFKEVNEIYEEAIQILDMEERPELFVTQTPILNAFAFGIDKPIIVLNSATLDILTPEELQALLAHELGHIASGHMLYNTVLIVLIILLRYGGIPIPFGSLGINAFLIAMSEWKRKSELTCDRAGMLVTQDLETCIRVDMKLAGGRHIEKMNIDEFLKQAEEYEKSGDILDSIFKVLNVLGTSHPYAVMRVKEIKAWHDSGSYKDILNGQYTTRVDQDHLNMTAQWKEAAKKYHQDIKSSGDPLDRIVGGMTSIGENIFQAGNRIWENFFHGDAKSPENPPEGSAPAKNPPNSPPPGADPAPGEGSSSASGWKSWPADGRDEN